MTTAVTSKNGKAKGKVTDEGTVAPAPDGSVVSEIPRLAAETILVPIIGTAPLIMNKWSTKAMTAMLDAQQGRKSPKQNRDPEADYEASIYRLPAGELGEDRYGFPVLAFKAATISAARYFGKSVTMTSLRQFVFFNGEVSDDGTQSLVPILGEPRMRQDMVRVGTGTDLRFRAEFPEWSAALKITYVTTSISRDSVLSLVDAGGMGVGVGEWRPEKKGQSGTYTLDESRDYQIL